MQSHPCSTADLGRPSDGRHPPKHSKSTYACCNKPVLLRSIELSQYRSWAFGRRLRAAGLLGSMGSIGDAYDNSAAESFFGTLQLELLDEHHWNTRRELAQAIFEWVECWYNPKRRQSYCKMLSPVDYEARFIPAETAARSSQPTCPAKRGMLIPCN